MKKNTENATQETKVLKTSVGSIVLKNVIISLVVGIIICLGLVAYFNFSRIIAEVKSFFAYNEVVYAVTASNDGEVMATEETVNIGGITIKVPLEQKATYDGTAKSITVNGYDSNKVGMQVEYYKDGVLIENDAVVNAGEYLAKVVFYTRSEEVIVDVVFTIEKATITHTASIDPEKLTFTYDGEEKSAEILGADTIADGAYTVKYLKGEEVLDGKPTDAGEYTVQLIVGDDINYALSTPIEATLVIEKASASASDFGIKFPAKTEEYEYNTAHSHAVEGDTTGFEVTYVYYNASGEIVEPESIINAGTYRVVATLVSENYCDIVLESNLIITKKLLDADNFQFLYGDVALGEADVTYDGEEKVVTVSTIVDLPADVEIEKILNEKVVSAGVHMVEVIFKANDNYEFPAVFSFITVKKADITGVTVENVEVPYDGKAHTVELEGELPAGATLVEPLTFTEVGTHTVIIRVNGGANYNDFTTTATITILPSQVLDVVVNSIQSVTYNGEKHLPTILGAEGLTVKYFIGEEEITEGVVDAKDYVITVEVSDEHYKASFEVTFTIEKAALSGYTIPETIVPYDREEHKASVAEEVIEGVDVVIEYYVGETKFDGVPKNIGTYIVVATLSGANYEEYKIFSTLTIVKATFTEADLKIEGTTHIYDAEEKNVKISLVEAFTEEIIKNENIVITVDPAVINAGVYEQRYTITADNYETYTNVVRMVIEKADLDLGEKLYTETNLKYNGASHTVALNEETLKQLEAINATVSYYGNEAIAVGNYVATIVIESANYKTEILNVEWKVEKGTLIAEDQYEALFADGTVIYNANEQYLQIKYDMLPEGTLSEAFRNNNTIVYRYTLTDGEVFEIIYSGEKAVNVGKYTQIVTIKSHNYNVVEAEAEIDVIAADFLPEDFGISFEDMTVVYDGATYSIYIAGNEDGFFTVEYFGNGVINAGEHTVKAVLKNSNYNDYTLSATITITPATIDTTGITFGNLTLDYDGLAHMITPEGVANDLQATITCTGADGNVYAADEVINAGTYTVTLTLTKENYTPVEIKAEIVIKKIKLQLEGVSVKSTNVTYNGQKQYLTIEGLDNLPADVTYAFNIDCVDVGSYMQTVTFSGANYSNTVELKDMLTIVKAEITGIDVYDLTVPYSGDEVVIELEGQLPAGTKLQNISSYTKPGTYKVTVTVSGGENYKNWTKTVNLVILDTPVLDAKVSSTQSVVRDSDLHLPKITGIDNEDVTVEYYLDGKISEGVKKVGTYKFAVVITDEHGYSKTFNTTLTVTPNYKLIIILILAASLIAGLLASLIMVLVDTRNDVLSQKYFIKSRNAVLKARGDIVCESRANSKEKKAEGRLYLTKATLEFYAYDYNKADNNFLIHIADIRNVNAVAHNKIVVYANGEAFTFTVPAAKAKEWAENISRI